MKKILLILLFMLTLPAFSQEGPTYPGEIFYVTPSFSTGYLKGFRGFSQGGEIRAGLDFEELQNHPLVIGLEGGYGYLAEDGSETAIFPHLTVKMGWIYRPSGYLRLLPYGGLTFIKMDTPCLYAGVSADFRLYKRNYLSLDVSVTESTGSDKDGHWSLGLGLKRPVPILRVFPPLTLTHTLSTRTFSPDGDGIHDTLDIGLETVNGASCKRWSVKITDHLGNPVIDWSGRGEPPERIGWNGISAEGEMAFSASDYRLSIEMEDKLGNRIVRDDYFVTDVFVEHGKDGQLRIRIPGILFSSGRADFRDLSEEEMKKNEDIISRLKVSLDKFPDYRILIEGYGNLLYWADEERAKIEQEEVLIPLSRSRAARIREYLISKGIDGERIEVVGRGGESPLVPFGDEENRWKNRRVEFILLK